jgi:hypothetical protein
MTSIPGIFVKSETQRKQDTDVADNGTAVEETQNDIQFQMLREAIVEYSQFSPNEQEVLEILQHVDRLHLDSANTGTPPQPNGDPSLETISEFQLELLAYHTQGPPSRQALELARRILYPDKDLGTQLQIEDFNEQLADMLQFFGEKIAQMITRKRSMKSADVDEINTSGPVMAPAYGALKSEMNSELTGKRSLSPNAAFFLGAVALPGLACVIDEYLYDGPKCGHAVMAIALSAWLRLGVFKLESPEVTKTLAAAWVAVILDLLVVGAIGMTVQANKHRWVFCAQYIMDHRSNHIIHPHDFMPQTSFALDAVQKFGLLQLVAQAASSNKPANRVWAKPRNKFPEDKKGQRHISTADDLPWYIDWDQNYTVNQNTTWFKNESVQRFENVMKDYVIERGWRPDGVAADALFVVWMTAGQFPWVFDYVNGNLPGWKGRIGNYKFNFGVSAAAWVLMRALVYGFQDFNKDDRQITWQDMQIPHDHRDYIPERRFNEFFDGEGESDDDPANVPWKLIPWNDAFALELFIDNLQLFEDNQVVDPGVAGAPVLQALPQKQRAFIQSNITPGYVMGVQNLARNSGRRRMDVFKNIYHSLKKLWEEASNTSIWSRVRLDDQYENYFTRWRHHYTWLSVLSMSYVNYKVSTDEQRQRGIPQSAITYRRSTSPGARRGP